MLFHQRHLWLFVLLTGLVVYFSACQEQLVEQTYTQMDPAYEDYLKGYTTGAISRSSKVQIIFSEDHVKADKIGTVCMRDFISLSPQVEGSWQWISKRAVAFYPKEVLPADQGFSAALSLDVLYPDIDSDLRKFDFKFRTRALTYKVELEGLETPDYSNWAAMGLSGVLYTSDYAPPADVEKMLKVEFDAPEVTVDWEHSDKQRTHRFYIKGLERSEQKKELVLRWDGSPIGVAEREEQQLALSARGKFELLYVSAHQSQDSYSRPYLHLQFSDPLLPNQSIEGLVRVGGYEGQETSFEYTVQGSHILLYLPDQGLRPSYEVEVAGTLRNFKGKRLGIMAKETVELKEVLRPQIALINGGTILPSEGDFIFPFSAKGLEAVEVEVFKIEDDNILQFLQENSLAGSNELYRVGRIVHQEKLDLRKLQPDADFSTWRRYAVNLNTFIKRDPSALYQVRLAFRKEFALLNCSNLELDEVKDTETRSYQPDENGAYRSILNRNYYGTSDNPCMGSYYNTSHFIAQNILGSNLGVTVKQGVEGDFLVAVNNLLSSAPESGATVKLYSFSQELLQNLKTDKNGFCKVARLAQSPAFMVVEKGGQRAYLRLRNGLELPTSRFDVSGTTAEAGSKGKLYAERGVWRPGDSIFLTFVLEDKEARLPEHYPITLRLYDPNNKLVEERRSAEEVNKVYPLPIATHPNAPTGTWRAEVTVGGKTFNKNLRIETIRPNRLKIDLNVDRERLEEAVLAAEVDVRWLQGATAANKRFKLVGNFSPLRTTFENYPAYVFDDPARSVSQEPFVLYDKKLDENGQAEIKANLERSFQAPGMLKLSLNARAFEHGGNFSINNTTVPYAPFDRFVGLKLPKAQAGLPLIGLSEKGRFDFALVSPKGKPVSGRQQLNIGVYKISSRWWIELNEEDISNFNSAVHLGAVFVDEVQTDGNGKVSWEYQPRSKGKFLIRVCDEESGHCTGGYFYAGESWRMAEDNGRMAATALNLYLDKASYEVGEEVEVQLPSAEGGRALVTVENGHRVLEHFWVKTQAQQTVFRFKTDAAMAPSAYVHVSLIQPHRQTQNDLPIRLYGIAPLQVVDPATKLAPQIEMAEVLAPEKPVRIKVSESSGKAMTYTLAVVDEGLLDITNFKTPELWSHFYRKEALGVRTWDMFNEVIGAYAGKLEHIFSIGGGLTRGGPDSKFNRFKPVVKYFGPFELKAGGKAEHEFVMPKYVGSVRTMLIASHRGAYGSAEETTPVRSPVMVLGTLPRTLAVGDRIQLPVAAFAMESDIRNVEVTVRASGAAKIIGTRSKSLRFERPMDKMLYFDVEAGEQTGVARFEIEAKSGVHKGTYEVELQVENPNPPTTLVKNYKVPPGSDWSTDFSYFGPGAENSVTLEVSTVPSLNLAQRLDYLKGYPHGCIEQTVSKGFPQMLAARLLQLDQTQRTEVDEYVSATIRRVGSMQLSGGGFGYWPNARSASPWGSTYAGHFLLEAKALGYAVSSFTLDRWLNYEQQNARSWSYSGNSESARRNSTVLQQSYRLYALALAQKPMLAEMNNLRDLLRSVPRPPAAAVWRLAAAYALAAKPKVAADLVAQARRRAENYPSGPSVFAHPMRDDAMILEAMLYLDKKTEATELAERLSERLQSGDWYSTQTSSFALVALSKMAPALYEKQSSNFSYQFGDGASTTAALSDAYFFQAEIADKQAQTQRLRLRNNSGQALYVSVITKGKPAAKAQPAFAKNVKLDISYLSLDGKPLEASKLPQGTDFAARVVFSTNDQSIQHPYLALTQVFPAGWEILNVRIARAFEGLGGLGRGEYNYRDVRDDRVMTYFDFHREPSTTFYVVLNASYQGRFYQGSSYVEDMYDNRFSAASASGWVEVVPAVVAE